VVNGFHLIAGTINPLNLVWPCQVRYVADPLLEVVQWHGVSFDIGLLTDLNQ
jgi:hypothetical protein